MAPNKPKYDPNAQYIAQQRIFHDGLKQRIEPPAAGDATPFTFDMSHRSPEEVEYLVDARKLITPYKAAPTKQASAK